MIAETRRPTVREPTSVVAVGATSTAGFTRLLPALRLRADVSEVRSVLVIGIAKLNPVLYFAPTTGLIRLEDITAEEIRLADRAASAAVMPLEMDVASRHCACNGWRDARLCRVLSAYDCQSLFVHASDVPTWRRRGLRRRLAAVGVSLVVVDAKSTGGGES